MPAVPPVTEPMATDTSTVQIPISRQQAPNTETIQIPITRPLTVTTHQPIPLTTHQPILPRLAQPSSSSIPNPSMPINLPPRKSQQAKSTNEKEKTIPVRPVPLLPNVTTMLHQNQALNQQISDLMLARSRCSTAPPPGVTRSSEGSQASPSAVTPTAPDRPASTPMPSMSPLYNLDSGDCIMVRTEQIGPNRKVHHLYLYSPNRAGGTATITDISSLSSLMTAQNQQRLAALSKQPTIPEHCDPTVLSVSADQPLHSLVTEASKTASKQRSRRPKAKPKPSTSKKSAKSTASATATRQSDNQSADSATVSGQSEFNVGDFISNDEAMDMTLSSSSASALLATEDNPLTKSPTCATTIGNALNAIICPTPPRMARLITPSPYRPKPTSPIIQHGASTYTEQVDNIVEEIPNLVPTQKISDIPTAQAMDDVEGTDTGEEEEVEEPIDVGNEKTLTFTEL